MARGAFVFLGVWLLGLLWLSSGLERWVSRDLFQFYLWLPLLGPMLLGIVLWTFVTVGDVIERAWLTWRR